MENMRCAIYTRYGLGPQCPKQAAIGSDTCGTHKFLEAKLGTLPRQPVAAPVAVSPVTVPVMVSAAELVPMAARATLSTMADSFAAMEPVETPAPVAETVDEPVPAKTRKARKDKGVSRKRS